MSIEEFDHEKFAKCETRRIVSEVKNSFTTVLKKKLRRNTQDKLKNVEKYFLPKK
jgi:hypothetical protein